jgi:hypothetical protein
MKTTLSRLGAVLALGLLLSTPLHAILITPATVPQITGNDNSNLSDAQISALVGSTVTTQYKADVDDAPADSGPFATSYTTVYSNPANDPADADIDYVGGSIITGTPAWLYVKDGNQQPAFYLFNLTALGWTGTQALDLRGFWPNNGAISHIAILTGTNQDAPGVPDGGATIVLLGVALLGLAAVRRRFAA